VATPAERLATNKDNGQRWHGRRTSRTGQADCSHAARSRSRTRSSSAPTAEIAACATSSRRLMLDRQGSWSKYSCARRARSEEPGGQEKRLADRRRRHVGDGIRGRSNQVDLGNGQSVRCSDASIAPATISTNSVISWDPDAGKDELVFQLYRGRNWDYDEGRARKSGRRPGRWRGQGQRVRQALTIPACKGLTHTMERNNGQNLLPNISRKHQLAERHSTRRRQAFGIMSPMPTCTLYARVVRPRRAIQPEECPGPLGGNNLWPATYSPKTKLI